MRWLVFICLLKGDLGDIGELEFWGDNGGVFFVVLDRWFGKSDRLIFGCLVFFFVFFNKFVICIKDKWVY